MMNFSCKIYTEITRLYQRVYELLIKEVEEFVVFN